LVEGRGCAPPYFLFSWEFLADHQIRLLQAFDEYALV